MDSKTKQRGLVVLKANRSDSDSSSPSIDDDKKNNDKLNDEFISNLNLKDTNNKYNYNEPKVSLKVLSKSMKKIKSAPIDDEEQKKASNVLLHDDEDLGDVVDPTHYKEEITIYQTVSLGISEVDQVLNMIDSINYLINMEKLLSAGNKLDERIKAEKLKKSQNKKKT